MKILLTGPNSFSGKVLLKFFIEKGYAVTVISRTPLHDVLPSKVRLINADLTQLESLNDKFDAVVHMAATSPSVGVTNFDLIQNNILATTHLINAVKNCGIEKLVFFSSCSVYGEVSQPILTENTPIYNPCIYGVSKLMCESLLREQKSYASVALRLPAILGRGAARHWLANVASKALSGVTVDIFNPNAVFNNAIHVSELAKFVDHLLQINSHEYFDVMNIASCDGLSICSTVSRVIEKLNSNSKIELSPTEKNAFTISNQYAIEKYGFEPMSFSGTLDTYLNELVAMEKIADRVV